MDGHKGHHEAHAAGHVLLLLLRGGVADPIIPVVKMSRNKTKFWKKNRKELN